MNETQTNAPAPRKRHGLLRVLLWICGIFIVLLVAGYFFLTSSNFLKNSILPRVSKSLNADITVSDASIHPFTSVTLKDLKVTPHGRETLLTAPEVRARYGLFDILRGNILIEEIALTSPVIHLVERADGTSNLDPILQSQSEEDEDSEDADDSAPPKIDLRKLSLSKATFRQEKLYEGNHRDIIEVSDINVLLTNLKNGDSGKLTVAATTSIKNNPPAPGAEGALAASVDGEYVFALSADLKPLSIKGNTLLKVSRAEGAFADLAELSVNLAADVAPNDIKQIALQFQKAGAPLGQLHLSGPFSMETTEGRLRAELLALDRRVLNLAGASSGIDFGTTTINSTNDIQFASGGAAITVMGRFSAEKLQLIQTNQSTPTLDLTADYDLTVNTAASNAVLRTLSLNGTQDGKPLLQGNLNSPMNISLGGQDNAVGDSALKITVANLNLADWKIFLGDAVSDGVVNLTMTILSQQSGKHLGINLVSQLANIAPIGGDKKLTSASLNADLAVQFGANEENAVKGGIQFSNVVVNDPSGIVPQTPLEARLNLDITTSPSVTDLRQFQVTLTPTYRAKNQLQLQGRIDMSDTNAIQGKLQLAAESLDLTTYYDLFSGATNQTAAKPAKGQKPSQPSENPEPEQEPPAMSLPFKNFTVGAKIGALYLREVEVTNFQTTLNLDGGRVLLKPMQFTLNGAPVNATADIDLNVPGYRYALEFSADRIPVAPLANSFAVEYRGKAQGDLIARATIKGAGTTGVNLQKNLSGDVHLSFTNANIQLVGPKMRRIVVPISIALRIPEVADSPLNWLFTDVNIADGKINLSQVRVNGPAFAASSQGTITIAPVLNNSTIPKLPIHFALSRNLAARAGFKGASDTNNAYVDLGPIAHVSGTLESPETKVDYGRIALLTGEQLIGGTAGEVLRGVGGLATGTNTVGELIQGFGGLLGGKQRSPTNSTSGALTNQPSTAPAATNQSPLSDVLKLLGPKTK